MNRLTLVSLLVLFGVLGVAFAGGHIGHHGIEHHHHKGWGWGPKYHGWATVSHWQSPHSYSYGIKEGGHGWAKQIWQAQEFKGWHHG